MSYDIVAVTLAARKRRKQVLAMRRRKMTFEAIATTLGVTRQRAYAIHREALKAEGLTATAE